jgi:hypothetical protein
MMAYLVNMAIRLHLIYGVLKDTGSLYIHCDPTASHYLKTILDAIFGPCSFGVKSSGDVPGLTIKQNGGRQFMM